MLGTVPGLVTLLYMPFVVYGWLQAWKDHMLLRSTLTEVEVECQAARTQVSALQRKLHALQLEVEVRICLAQTPLYFDCLWTYLFQFIN